MFRSFSPVCEADVPTAKIPNHLSPSRRHAHTQWSRRFCLAIVAMLSIGPVIARPQQTAASSPVGGTQRQLSPAEIDLYKGARTLIDWTPSQIRKSPDLRGVRLAGSARQLPAILERVGQSGTLLYQDFPQVSCDEEIVSDARSIDPVVTHGMVHYPTLDRRYRYIVIPAPVSDLPEFEEYRTDPKGRPIDNAIAGSYYMLTSGFASISLYLLPFDQNVTRFRYFGVQSVRNRECHVVGFAQDPLRVHRVGDAVISGRSFAILIQGLAWIDGVTFQILRMKTWLLAPRKDIGLTSQTSTVDFYPVTPSGSEKVLWLPREVTVEIDYHDVEIRNTHLYSNFKLFRVESTIKTGE